MGLGGEDWNRNLQIHMCPYKRDKIEYIASYFVRDPSLAEVR